MERQELPLGQELKAICRNYTQVGELCQHLMANRCRYDTVPIDIVVLYVTSAVIDLMKSHMAIKAYDDFLKLENRECLSTYYATDTGEIVSQCEECSVT